MNPTPSKPPEQGAVTTGGESTPRLAPNLTPTEVSAAPIAGPGGPIIPPNSIDPPAADGPGGHR